MIVLCEWWSHSLECCVRWSSSALLPLGRCLPWISCSLALVSKTTINELCNHENTVSAIKQLCYMYDKRHLFFACVISYILNCVFLNCIRCFVYRCIRRLYMAIIKYLLFSFGGTFFAYWPAWVYGCLFVCSSLLIRCLVYPYIFGNTYHIIIYQVEISIEYYTTWHKLTAKEFLQAVSKIIEKPGASIMRHEGSLPVRIAHPALEIMLQ